MGLNYPKNQGTEWINLNNRVRSAFTAANRRVPYQKIAAGIVRISTSLELLANSFMKFFYLNGTEGIFLGSGITFSGVSNEGLWIKRNTGSTMFTALTSQVDGAGFTGTWDASGNIVVSDDASSGQGLARPWIPHTFVTSSEIANPPSARQASGTTDTVVVSMFTPLQHGKIQFIGYVTIFTAGATAEIKFKDSATGTVLYSKTTAEAYVIDTFSMGTWSFGENRQIDVTIRRASGTGNVGFTLISCHGRQS